MNQDLPEFDDPGLRVALKRAFGDEAAPEHLRRRILGIASPVETRQRTFWLRRSMLAAAAALLIVLGGTWAWYGRDHSARIAQPMLAALVARHDGCCSEPAHTLPEFANMPLDRVAQAMGHQLNTPILMARLDKDGYPLKGPALCPVDGQLAAHIIFGKGSEQISVFSVPAKAGNGALDGSLVLKSESGHSIAAFVKDGAVYCLVGTCDKGKLGKLLQEHEGEVVKPVSTTVALAELHWQR